MERNEFLSVEGDINTNIYFIVEGSIKLFVTDNDEEQIIRFDYKNNIIVCLDYFLQQKPSRYYTQAIKNTVLKVITKQQFD